MKKYRLVGGPEVTFGDVIYKKIVVSKDNLEGLIKAGILEEYYDYPQEHSYYLEKLAKKLGYCSAESKEFIWLYDSMRKAFPMQIITMTLSLIRDKANEVHKGDGIHCYVIGVKDGKIYEDYINEYANISYVIAFNTKEDALNALSIIGDGILDGLFRK